MGVMFGNWKYIMKNLWYVLPFALLPALFMCLSLDYGSIRLYVRGFFGGNTHFAFYDIFRVWSVIRIDSWLGGVYSVCAVACTVFFMAVMLSVVEKHMRIGKRNFSGAFSQLDNNFLSALGITLLYAAIYEIWALALSAILFAFGSLVGGAAGAYVLIILCIALFIALLLYVVTVFFLWFPCRQMTGFGVYEAFRYSYQLMVNVRGRLMLALLISLIGAYAVIAVSAAFLPELVFRLVAFVLYNFLFMAFCVRMETVYFATEKLDREDILRSYREL